MDIFVFAMILMIMNFIMIYKPIPIFAFPIGIFSFAINAIVFLPSGDIPANPFSSIFMAFIAVIALIVNGMSFSKK